MAETEITTGGLREIVPPAERIPSGKIPEEPVLKAVDGIRFDFNVTVEQIADFDGDGTDDLRIRTSAGDVGAQLVRSSDAFDWRYCGSVGQEWSTRLAAI